MGMGTWPGLLWAHARYSPANARVAVLAVCKRTLPPI